MSDRDRSVAAREPGPARGGIARRRRIGRSAALPRAVGAAVAVAFTAWIVPAPWTPPARATFPAPVAANPAPPRALASLTGVELDRELEVRQDHVRQVEAELRGTLGGIGKAAEQLSALLKRAMLAGVRAEAARIRQPDGGEARGHGGAIEALAGEFERRKADLGALKARARWLVDARLGPASNRMAEVLTEIRRRKEYSRIDQAIDAASGTVLELEPGLVRRR